VTSPPPSAERRQALRADADSLYARQLAADPAAQDYLAARGISPALARRLELGAAGHGWTGAVDSYAPCGSATKSSSNRFVRGAAGPR